MQRAQVRVLVVTLVAASLAWIAYRVTDTVTRRRPDLVMDALRLLPDAAQRLQDFHRVKLENGRMIWELRAQEAQLFEEEHRAVVQGPEMIFYGDGTERGRVRGDEGVLILDGAEIESVELRGAVRVEGDGYVLETEQATYVRARDVIVAPGAVRISGKRLAAAGDQMEIDVSDRRLVLRGTVRVTLAGRDDHPS